MADEGNQVSQGPLGKTLRLVWPQWQGAGRDNVAVLLPEFPFATARTGYAMGARVLNAILAHEEFVEKGYDPTTMSAIAKRAGCTSAMITYYFESKQRLFRACFNLPLDPAETILEHLSEGREGAGDRIARRAFQFYEEGTSGETLRVLMQTLMTDAGTSQRFRDYIRNDVIGEVGAKLGITTELAEEVEIAMAATFGIITMRYIVRLEPLASMPKERLIRELGAILQIRIDRAFSRLERSQER